MSVASVSTIENDYLKNGFWAYKIEDEKPAPFVFTGIAAAFAHAGFKEVARNPALSKVEGTPTRPIFRYLIPSKGKEQGEGK